MNGYGTALQDVLAEKGIEVVRVLVRVDRSKRNNQRPKDLLPVNKARARRAGWALSSARHKGKSDAAAQLRDECCDAQVVEVAEDRTVLF